MTIAESQEATMTTGYGARLARLVAARGPLCAGIDPHPALLTQWGLPVNARGLERCARTMVDTLGDLVPVFKPQSAFFEMHGSQGIAVLERVLADLREAGALSLLDVKRGDIGSTMDAYAAAYLADGAPLAADAITVSPYLGFGSLAGTIALAEEEDRGVYVLALTSNPEGFEVQHAVREGRSVAASVVAGAATDNAGAAARGELGSVGLVIGATVGDAVHDLGIDLVAADTPILAPGFGAQGGTVEALRRTFAGALPQVLASSSREVLGAGPDVAALRAAATTTATRLQDALHS